MKKILISFLIGALVLINFANFVSSQEICDKELDSILVIDNSVSIPVSQFNLIKTDSVNFLDLLNSSIQRIGLINFARNGVLLQGLTNNFAQVATKINLMSQPFGDPTAGTNMGEGIDKARIEFDTSGINVPQYIILISDGVPNRMPGQICSQDTSDFPTNCTNYALEMAQEAKDNGITIYTIGSNVVSNSFQEYFMKDIASDNSKYFSSVNFSNLENIYNQIGTEICGDDEPPAVISTIPENGAINIGVNQHISATFSENMNPSTVNSNTFIVQNGLISVPGTVTLVNNIATFVASSSLLPNTIYTVTVTNEVEDLSGNNMVNNYTWGFTTGNGNEPICGNEIKEQGEECDDGNTNNDDECTSLCTLNDNGYDDEDNNGYDDDSRIIDFGTLNGDCSHVWNCTNWSNCLNGVQTRTCTCDVVCPNAFTDKPVELRTCGESNLNDNEKQGNLIWVFFWILFVACVLILLVILILRMIA